MKSIKTLNPGLKQLIKLTKTRSKMNPTIVDRMSNQSVFGKKVRIPKRYFNNKEPRTNYARDRELFTQAAEATGIDMKKFANLERRKQHKVRYDTLRREELPTVEDIRIENLHYANFLGDKYGYNGSKYNSKYSVNLRFCDSRVEIDEEPAYSDLDSLAERARLMDEGSDLDSLAERARLLDEGSDLDSLSEISLGSSSFEESYDEAQLISQKSPRVGFTRVNSGDTLWLMGANDYGVSEEENNEEFNSLEELISRLGPYQKALQMDWAELPVDEDEYDRYQEEMLFDEMVVYMKRQIMLAEEMMSGYKRKAEDNEGNAFKRARCDDESNNV
jgi:hypothetical protein